MRMSATLFFLGGAIADQLLAKFSAGEFDAALPALPED